jgi:hypothetical protein
VEARGPSGFDWRDAAAYAPLLGADRSLFAWEWLRRDAHYRAAAERAAASGDRGTREDPAAAAFGLVAFERPDRAVPNARPLWRQDVHPHVLVVERVEAARPGDDFDLQRLEDIATLVPGRCGHHLLLSDGLRTVRLDGPCRAFSCGPACLRYRIEGLVSAEPGLLALRRLLALCGTGHFARSLHPPEARARRWILMLRACDALAAGAGQREIAELLLLSRSAAEPRWRSREPSVRSQAQRLVRSARAFEGGGYRALLANRPEHTAWT